jgi:hypothetical protein
MKTMLKVLGASVALLCGGAASAHHSFAMFDGAREAKIEGVVKTFEWTNPHSWLQVVVTDAAGKSADWGIEVNGPAIMSKLGWTRHSIKTGDKVVVMFNPLKSGEDGGRLTNILVNGAPIPPLAHN